jgi:hypothetical protein
LHLLALDQLVVGRFFDLQIALHFGLARHRGSFRGDAFLISLCFGHC